MDEPVDYYVDPEDPRAPPQDVWDRMSASEREHVCRMLPAAVPTRAWAAQIRDEIEQVLALAEAKGKRRQAELERIRAELERIRAELGRIRAEERAEQAEREKEREKARAEENERRVAELLAELERTKKQV